MERDKGAMATRFSGSGTATGENETYQFRARIRPQPLYRKEALRMQIDREERALKELYEPWKELAGRTEASLYLSPEWVENWWNCFGRHPRRSLFLISFWNGEEMVGLAPLYVGSTGIGRICLERRAQLLGSGGSPNEQFGYLDDYGISDFLDIVADEPWAPVVADLLADFLLSENAGVERVTFHQAGDRSMIMRHLFPALKRAHARLSLDQTDTCPYIDLKGTSSLEAYIRGVKSNARRRLRQTLRAAGPEQRYAVRKAVAPEEVVAATDRVIRLHQKRWNRLGFPGVFHDPRFETFFRELVRTAHRREWLWFAEAVGPDGVCASRMALLYNGRYYDYISGFDDESELSRYRPGFGVLLHMIENALESGVERIELLRGEEGYKYDFTADRFQNWRVAVVTTQGEKAVRRALSAILKPAAMIYRIAAREKRLLQVQRKRNGVPGMVQGYLSFRIASLQRKRGE